jgi:hypothetical protein
VRTRRDVKKHHLVRTLIIVPLRKFHWISHIAQPPLLRTPNLNTARDLTVVNIETGNDAFSDHANRHSAQVNAPLQETPALF